MPHTHKLTTRSVRLFTVQLLSNQDNKMEFDWHFLEHNNHNNDFLCKITYFIVHMFANVAMEPNKLLRLKVSDFIYLSLSLDACVVIHFSEEKCVKWFVTSVITCNCLQLPSIRIISVLFIQSSISFRVHFVASFCTFSDRWIERLLMICAERWVR